MLNEDDKYILEMEIFFDHSIEGVCDESSERVYWGDSKGVEATICIPNTLGYIPKQIILNVREK